MDNLRLRCLDGQFVIYQYPPQHPIPAAVYASHFLSITKTDEELSIVCDAAINLEAEKIEHGWSCLKVLGPLDFSLTGILAKLSAVLAEAEISLFAVSTYNTDYILVKSEKLEMAIETLSKQGYITI